MTAFQVRVALQSAFGSLAALLCSLVLAAPTVEAQSGLAHIYADYVAPVVALVQPSGERVSFPNLVDGSRPVVVEFFYTSCTTICGLQSSALALAKRRLGRDTLAVSISIDPEYDTPQRLRDYARNFPAGPNWYLLTGSRADILKVETAFDARPLGDNKMLHRPLIFMRTAPGRQWTRLEGLYTSDQIVAEMRNARAHPAPQSSSLSSLHESFNRIVGR